MRSEYPPDHGDACGFTLSLDANPSEPKDEAGRILFPDLQKGLAKPHGEQMLAMVGQLYGATTHYRDKGHFVVWSTAPDEAWKPSDLPALDDI